MRTPTAVLDLEISGKFTELNDIGDFAGALVLFRLHGRPLGWGAAQVTDGRVDRGALVRQLLEQHAWSCALPLAERAIFSGIPPRAIDVGSVLQSQPAVLRGGPLVTVAVCNRTAAESLRPCLNSLIGLEYAPLDLVVVDASDDRRNVEALVREHYPAIRYVAASGAGALARGAIAECRGEILALTQGDSLVDPRWVSHQAAVFLADPDVMAVSGLTLPQAIGRPMRAALPAGAPFCREWLRVEQGGDITAAVQRMLERPGVNVALWRPASFTTAPYTHVFEPSAIVRAPSASPFVPGNGRRVSLTHAARRLDLADALLPIADSDGADDLMIDVSWEGLPIGTAQIAHRGATVSPLWIADAIAQQLTVEILDARLGVGEHVCRALLTADLARHIVGRVGVEPRRAVAAARRNGVRAA